VKKFFIKTFGCAQNTADSQRIKAKYLMEGFTEVDNYKDADVIIINSCIVRESAENRVYGLVYNIRQETKNKKIIVTGCLSGVRKKIERVDEVMPISEISYDIAPIRGDSDVALVPISFGCNNFCSYCIVPYARGRETSRSEKDILIEIDKVIKEKYKKVLLIGQNVNSWNKDKFYQLLEKVAKKGFEKVSFISSNPWDFSDELIEVIAKYKNIDRLIHLPIQSGDDAILKKMNRPYTGKEYLDLINKIKDKVKDVRFSTDIIIGFPGEGEKEFNNTVKLCKKVGYEIAYVNKYSPRKGTVSAKMYPDYIPQKVKKERWVILDKLINSNK
jgi:tRNA-2-methylthio-N6-dimethylallyladenosine synthase